MIEIALALGVIGFALVAIIGILPVGLNVQKEAHQDTIISQDGSFLMEAIRNGGPTNGLGTSTSLDFLTNYVEYITVGGTTYTNDYRAPNYFGSGQKILGLLSTPDVSTTARIRGLTGAATEQSGSNSYTAFRYYMNVEIQRFGTPTASAFDATNAVQLQSEQQYLSTNLYEVRLKFSWPAMPNFRSGPGRQTYRSMVSGNLLPCTNGTATLWYFQPNAYKNL
jgi:hypothetical protein